MQVRRRLRHWSTASSITICSTSRHINQSQTAVSNHSHHAPSYGRLVAELHLRFCSQLDWGHGCLVPINLSWWIHGGSLHSALTHGVFGHLGPRSRCMIRTRLQKTRIDKSVSISGRHNEWCVCGVFLSECQLFHSIHSFFSEQSSACHWNSVDASCFLQTAQ